MRAEVRVALPIDEAYWAAHAGLMRSFFALKLARGSAHGADADGLDWGISIDGALAEYVVAKVLNLHWGGNGVCRGDDVGPYQVRSTRRENGRLLLHPGDDDVAIFILVTGCGLNYCVRGWLSGAQGKRPEYWDEQIRSPCFCVPQDRLHPIAELPGDLRAQGDDGRIRLATAHGVRQ